MGKEIIQIEHAYKQYGEKKVLDDFSLNIENNCHDRFQWNWKNNLI